jgi:hypothetical protein
MRRRITPGSFLVCFIGCTLAGCSSHEDNWLHLYDARAEYEALRTSADAEVIADELQLVREALNRAELALTKKHYDEVAAISEIVLLRVEGARAVVRQRLAEREAEIAESELDDLAKAVEAQRARLERAKAELATLSGSTPDDAERSNP